MESKIESEQGYKKVSALVNEWLELHKGETFDLDLVCRQLDIQERQNRKYAAIKLSDEVKAGKLEKHNKLYRLIDNTIKYIDWVNASGAATLALKWPWGHEDDSSFGFDGRVLISPGDIIVVAGNSNMGKTCFCLNLLWENMDDFPCTLMGNEYVASKFKKRVGRMTWANPLDDEGVPKFELIDRRSNWKDIIRPNNINIIDWINLPTNFYEIGMIIDGIQEKLGDGIAVISLQKDPAKRVGLGGEFSVHLSSLYMAIDYERLTVVKAKDCEGKNPSGEMYGFTIVEGGTKFHHIRRVKMCPKCHGSSSGKKFDCTECSGKGYVDYE